MSKNNSHKLHERQLKPKQQQLFVSTPITSLSSSLGVLILSPSPTHRFWQRLKYASWLKYSPNQFCRFLFTYSIVSDPSHKYYESYSMEFCTSILVSFCNVPIESMVNSATESCCIWSLCTGFYSLYSSEG